MRMAKNILSQENINKIKYIIYINIYNDNNRVGPVWTGPTTENINSNTYSYAWDSSSI